MLVHRNSSVRFNLHAEHENLAIFEFQMVMLRIYLDRVETAAYRLSRTGLFQFDLNDVKRVIADDLRRVHPVRRTPPHLTSLPLEDFRRSAVLVLEPLPPLRLDPELNP